MEANASVEFVPESFLKQEFKGYENLKQLNEAFLERNETCYLIFDEVQLLYEDKYNNFWQQIKMLLQSDLPSLNVFMVSSYTPNKVGGATPPELTEAHILQIPFLYCSEEEMTELNTFFNKMTTTKVLKVGEEAKNEIWKYTGGHIGIIHKVYKKLFHMFKPKTPTTTCQLVSQEEILQHFYSREMLLAVSSYRSFNGITQLSPSQKKILEQLFFAANSELDIAPPDKEDLKKLLLNGIVDYTAVNSKQIKWTFAMMETYVMKHIFVSPKRPTLSEWENKRWTSF